LFINLTPFIPLSLERRGGNGFERGANAPPKHSCLNKLLLSKEGEEILERGETPLSPPTPFPS